MYKHSNIGNGAVVNTDGVIESALTSSPSVLSNNLSMAPYVPTALQSAVDSFTFTCDYKPAATLTLAASESFSLGGFLSSPEDIGADAAERIPVEYSLSCHLGASSVDVSVFPFLYRTGVTPSYSSNWVTASLFGRIDILPYRDCSSLLIIDPVLESYYSNPIFIGVACRNFGSASATVHHLSFTLLARVASSRLSTFQEEY